MGNSNSKIERPRQERISSRPSSSQKGWFEFLFFRGKRESDRNELHTVQILEARMQRRNHRLRCSRPDSGMDFPIADIADSSRHRGKSQEARENRCLSSWPAEYDETMIADVDEIWMQSWSNIVAVAKCRLSIVD